MEKKKKEPTKNGIYIITIFLAILLLYFMNRYVSKDVTVFEDHYENEMTEAEVTRVLDRQTNSYGMESEYEDTTITFEAEVTKGPMKGQTVQAAQMIEGGYPDGAVVEVADGQEVLLLQMEDGEYSWMYVETVRSNAIVWLAGAFAVGLLIFGRK
ncbi:MAG TPA: hypothetical protein DHN33_04840, partial [Eubacteriaceae bacterium]|nr:hypothetical protein [Eubacteriaceae bacterium]